ncbi:MAG: ornithine cyclodeaminase family protein [Actinobacteria bacterium]|nr:ornithine cyclodeaminase family protein [Actinomycetota bacterium]
MQIVDLAAVRSVLTWDDALDAARHAFRTLSDGGVDQPGQLEMRPAGGGELHVKGAYLRGSAVMCFKVATGGFPGAGPDGFSVVLDAATGQARWLLADGGWLTDTRTAAAGAVASVTLARPDARRLLVVGTGGQAQAQVHAHRAAMPGVEVAVWGRDPARSAALAHAVGAAVVDDLEVAVRTSDVVVTATSSRTPLLDADWVRPGTHVTAVGSDTPGKQELPAALVAAAEVVVCDAVDLAAHAGELQHAAPDVVARAVTLGDVLTGRSPGRTSPAQVTVADLCGLGVQDATIAEVVVQRLSAGAT